MLLSEQRIKEIEELAQFEGDLNSQAIKELLEERKLLVSKIDDLETALDPRFYLSRSQGEFADGPSNRG